MAKEIEHKFKVINDSYKPLIYSSSEISQGYIYKSKSKIIRIRIIDDKALLTIKGETFNDTRDEYEYDIPLIDAKEMLRNLCEQNIIYKTRHSLKYDGEVWIVDEFHNELSNLRLAEIELPFSEYKYSIPPFAGENVTNNPVYYNSNLGNRDIII